MGVYCRGKALLGGSIDLKVDEDEFCAAAAIGDTVSPKELSPVRHTNPSDILERVGEPLRVILAIHVGPLIGRQESPQDLD
jgi:hypothetical protein